MYFPKFLGAGAERFIEYQDTHKYKYTIVFL